MVLKENKKVGGTLQTNKTIKEKEYRCVEIDNIWYFFEIGPNDGGEVDLNKFLIIVTIDACLVLFMYGLIMPIICNAASDLPLPDPKDLDIKAPIVDIKIPPLEHPDSDLKLSDLEKPDIERPDLYNLDKKDLPVDKNIEIGKKINKSGSSLENLIKRFLKIFPNFGKRQFGTPDNWD
jgi:hypothetical protein